MASTLAKNNKIATTLKSTRTRRQTQCCRVYELKINRSKLNQTSRDHLRRLFLEAKWFYNWVLSQSDPFAVDIKIGTVPVRIGDRFENRELCCLSSQMKQALVTQIQTAIKTLAKLKKKGQKVGRLKFKRFIGCIPLKQYLKTHQLDLICHRVKLQKLKQHLRVHGYQQFPTDAEFANAQVFTRHGNYYIHIVTYQPRCSRPCNDAPLHAIRIDGGLQQQLTFSNGVTVEYRVPFPKRIRQQYRYFSRKRKGSRNRWKARQKLENQFRKLTNIKIDIRNQLVAYLCRNYGIICFQDENLSAWHRLWGKKMLDLSLGAFFRILAERTRTPIEIDRFFPSTQHCSDCNHRQKLTLDEHRYNCPVCGLTLDRDYNAAINLLLEGLRTAPFHDPEQIVEMPVETKTTTQRMMDVFDRLAYVRASLVEEAGSPSIL